MRPERVHNFGTYFIGAQTWERRALFHSERMAKLFVETLYAYRAQSKYLLHEFVLMPDHFHALITPDGHTLERSMQFIKGGFSRRAREISRMEIWQKGFTDHRLRDWADYHKHRHYIRLNPVKARLSEAPEHYPYCSAFPGFELDPIPQRLKPISE